MNDHRHAGASTDGTLDRDIARALAVDPSPEFVARVRTRIAQEPEPGMWRRASAFAKATADRRSLGGGWSALRSSWLVASVAAAVVAGVVVTRSNRSVAPANTSTLTARAISGQAPSLPYVASGFSRTSDARGSTGSPRAGIEFARPERDDQPPRFALRPSAVALAKAEGRARDVESTPLLDPREMRALRALIAGVRDSRVDLTSLLRAGAPAPMELPPVDDLVIAPLAIEPLAPIDGAQGVRQ